MMNGEHSNNWLNLSGQTEGQTKQDPCKHMHSARDCVNLLSAQVDMWSILEYLL